MKTSKSSTANRQACEWIAKLNESDLSDSEHQQLKAWMAQSKENSTEIRRMAQRWDELNALTFLAVPAEQKSPVKALNSSFTSVAKVFGGAAAVTALSLFIVSMWPPQSLESPQISTNQETSTKLQSYSTDIGEQRLITLPDNSTVLLNTKSQFNIAYNDEFRDIYLVQGEAHFDVVSSPQRPFRVFAGKSRVLAVGTAFSIHLKKATVDVTVTHGSVKIDSILDKSSESIDTYLGESIVGAGQAAEFNQLAGTIETRLLPDTSLIPAWHHGKLRFSGEPLEQVVEEISRYSPMSIVILDSELRNLRIGGLFDVGETKKMFDALESGFKIKVEYINENLVHLKASS
ncbi:MAG: FecR domain-containing protein [Acidiferrobacterales bacterium]|nr:FecR domain-containing protein [Acidiferrobacterales bacterium]